MNHIRTYANAEPAVCVCTIYKSDSRYRSHRRNGKLCPVAVAVLGPTKGGRLVGVAAMGARVLSCCGDPHGASSPLSPPPQCGLSSLLAGSTQRRSPEPSKLEADTCVD